MNATEFNTELGKLIERAVNEGVSVNNMTAHNVLGIIEAQKLHFWTWHQTATAMAAAARAQAKKPPLIQPVDNGFQIPPRS
jgi:hypothetical protein